MSLSCKWHTWETLSKAWLNLCLFQFFSGIYKLIVFDPLVHSLIPLCSESCFISSGSLRHLCNSFLLMIVSCSNVARTHDKGDDMYNFEKFLMISRIDRNPSSHSKQSPLKLSFTSQANPLTRSILLIFLLPLK